MSTRARTCGSMCVLHWKMNLLNRECLQKREGTEASQEMARRPTLRMRRGKKWRGGQHSECSEARNGAEANIQKARRQEMALMPYNNRRGGLTRTGAEANIQNARRQDMARRPTLRMLGGKKWRRGQHSESSEARNSAEANIQNARRQDMAQRPTLILQHAKQVYSRHGNLLQPRALADAVDGELLLNVSSRILLQHCLFVCEQDTCRR